MSAPAVGSIVNYVPGGAEGLEPLPAIVVKAHEPDHAQPLLLLFVIHRAGTTTMVPARKGSATSPGTWF